MRIAIIDNRDGRAVALYEWIVSLKTEQGNPKYHVTRYISVTEERSANGDNIQDILIFLHVGEWPGNIDMRTELKNRYFANHVVCYSGGKTVAEDYEDHQNQFPSHYWYNNWIPIDGFEDHARINFQKFLDLYPNTPEILSASLRSFNPILEAKLDLLWWVVNRKSLEQMREEANWKLLVRDELSNKPEKRQLISHINNILLDTEHAAPDLSKLIELRRYLFEE